MTDPRDLWRDLAEVFLKAADVFSPNAIANTLTQTAHDLNAQKGFSMLRPLRIGTTASGVPHVRFEDSYGDRASFQDGPDHRQHGKTLWFGKDGARIAIDRERAAQLAEILERFARTGSIAE